MLRPVPRGRPEENNEMLAYRSAALHATPDRKTASGTALALERRRGGLADAKHDTVRTLAAH